MTPSDDDVLARLRAALHTVADRTPISGGRLEEAWAAPTQKRSRPVVTIASAAAAVAAIAAVAAVVAGTHSASRNLLPASEGESAVSGSPSAPVPTPTITMTPGPTPGPTPTITVTPSPSPPLSVAANCVPENYYVTASPSELEGLTYLLPAAPAGYRLYGAWGTISRNQCADSVTWYVEYDANAAHTGPDAIQLTVTKVGGDSIAGGFAYATPVASTPISVGGNEGFVFNKDGGYALIGWTTGGAAITLAGPVSSGDIASLVQVADSLVLVNPNDPRIVAPADCQVPAGSTCPSNPVASPSPSGPMTSVDPVPSLTPTASATPTATATATATPTPTR